MIHNEAEAIKEVLRTIDGVKSVSRGWPKAFARDTLPCIAIAKAADTPMDFRDDREHIAELEYYIRIFAEKATAVDAIAPRVDMEMEKMGYTRTFSYDDDESDVRMCALRYRKYV